MAKTVTLKINDQTISVPEGTLIVDAAKIIGNDIPVFCYHPKMEPVGMCRMCLVSIGRPAVDRSTRQPILNLDGTPKIAFGPKLETACTTPVSDGMVVVTNSQPVEDARREILEFLLTSHPLDCPICDKGGECPLQNLTLAYGPGKSRFLYDEKIQLAKHYPLGDLIMLDRERCIQCARCIRFQDEIADDPVIAFAQRGRALQIVTNSEPGFDSYFSGNTTDICPVGALTTVDFRFKARPWELKPVASICTQCPVGCNLTLNVRREVVSGGNSVVKRVMPRQNEDVNEIWICDKGRFTYHFAQTPERLATPVVKRDGEFVPIGWEEAFTLAAEKIDAAGGGLVTLAGGRLSNEDLFNLQALTKARGGKTVLDSYMAGGDLTAQVGVEPGTNFKDMGPGTAILVVASDLQEEAPVWFLRVKQAAERGAALIVVNPRPTKLERYAKHAVHYAYSRAAETMRAFLPEGAKDAPEDIRLAAEAFAQAENAVILFGSEGMGLPKSARLARACAELLVQTNHVGKPNNGLIGVWPEANTQGAWDMGFRPVENLAETLAQAGVAYIAAANPAGDSPRLADALAQTGFIIAQDLFLTETAQLADLVLPAASFIEREGSFTSGERRVQRYYQAVPPRGATPDFAITAGIARCLGLELEGRWPNLVFKQLAAAAPAYTGLTYQKLAEVREQWPIMGREDLFYGGTSYENNQGMGQALSTAAGRGESLTLPQAAPAQEQPVPPMGLVIVPVTKLYDRSTVMMQSTLLYNRVAKAVLSMHPDTAAQYGFKDGQPVKIELDGGVYTVEIHLDEELPLSVALLPRSVGVPLSGISVLKVPTGEEAGA